MASTALNCSSVLNRQCPQSSLFYTLRVRSCSGCDYKTLFSTAMRMTTPAFKSLSPKICVKMRNYTENFTFGRKEKPSHKSVPEHGYRIDNQIGIYCKLIWGLHYTAYCWNQTMHLLWTALSSEEPASRSLSQLEENHTSLLSFACASYARRRWSQGSSSQGRLIYSPFRCSALLIVGSILSNDNRAQTDSFN